MTVQDRIRMALLSYGEKEISCSIYDIINKTAPNKLSYSQVYQALYRLQSLGELTILNDESTARGNISGIRLLKMASESTIEEKIKAREASPEEVSMVALQVPNTLEYIKKRIAIERAREELTAAHLDPDSVLTFAPDPLGEEALILFQELTNTKKKLAEVNINLEAARRDIGYLKERPTVGVYDDSGT